MTRTLTMHLSDAQAERLDPQPPVLTRPVRLTRQCSCSRVLRPRESPASQRPATGAHDGRGTTMLVDIHTNLMWYPDHLHNIIDENWRQVIRFD